MEQLQATVQSKTAVPTAQVYVSFNGEKNQRVPKLVRSQQK